ncbi:hypothetical protein HMPREF1578_01108, partial [Gardnerella pickettii JCP8017B]
YTFLSAHYGYCVHFLTIGKAIVKKFKIGLIARYITILPVV